MALTAYLTLKIGGQLVQGSSRFKDREGQILVIGLSHEVTSDRDDAGLPSGKPKHRSMVVQKDIDRSSPILYQALIDNVPFDTCQVEFTRFSPVGGGQEIHAKIVLTGARISSIRGVMPNAAKPENGAIPEYEEVTLAYRSIEWNWLGKDVDDSDTSYQEGDCDFSADSPSWIDHFQKLFTKAMEVAGGAAGKAAAKALDGAVKGAIVEDEPK